MKQTTAKNGQIYYFGKNGKRISSKEFSRRTKISVSLKARKASKSNKTKEIFSSKNKVIGTRTYGETKDGWKKNSYKGKPQNLVINSWHKHFTISSSWVESIDEILPLMLESSLEIINEIKSSDITTKFISLGYDFSVKYSTKKGETHVFSHVGFTPRIDIKRSITKFREYLHIAFDDIASRFEGYLNRDTTKAVKLNFIIVEKLVSSKNEKSKKKK